MKMTQRDDLLSLILYGAFNFTNIKLHVYYNYAIFIETDTNNTMEELKVCICYSIITGSFYIRSFSPFVIPLS